jgi:hypothetical protein
MENKKLRTLLKKKLHPLISYAFLVGVGAIAVSGTASIAGTGLTDLVEPGLALQTRPSAVLPAHEEWPQDMASLKASAAEFSIQLAAIKSLVAELERLGRAPTDELLEAIGQGEQLVTVIAQANTLAEIGNFNAAMRLVEIGRVISENAKF